MILFLTNTVRYHQKTKTILNLIDKNEIRK